MAPHSSTLAWKIPWTEEPVGYSPWGREELDTTERLHFHLTSLGHSLAFSQNKGLREYQRRASRMHTRPLSHRRRQRGRQVTARAGRQWATPFSAPETSILYQTVSRLPVANQVFLGSWTVDICQEGHSLRSAPQRKHMAHLRQCSHNAPGKPSAWDREGD